MLVTPSHREVGQSLWWMRVKAYSLAVMSEVSRDAQFRAQEDWRDVYNIG